MSNDITKDWVIVEVPDRFQTWDWNNNAYWKWCQNHCSGAFAVSKIMGKGIRARFEKEGDATLFSLRWA